MPTRTTTFAARGRRAAPAVPRPVPEDAGDAGAWLEALGAELHPGRKFDLAHIRALLAALGHPERSFVSVHVAGTNGKGSIAAMIESAARAAGWRTGLYTSPHLERVTERVRIAGAEIAPGDWARLAARVRRHSDALVAAGTLPHPPSYFEAVTAIGFLAMAEAGMRLAVVEVGMGGRLDATNVIAPTVAVIGPVGLDHQAWLGDTLAAIAGEKAGIIKPGIGAVVMAPQPREAGAVVADRARAAGVPLLEAAPPSAGAVRLQADGTSAFEWIYHGAPLTLAPALAGRHQVTNAVCAALACEQLRRCGLAIPPAALQAGMRAVRWPGRLERLAVPGAPPVWLDGAHNPMAAAALAAFLDEGGLGAEAPVMVFACLRDKAAAEIAAILLPRAAAAVFTTPSQPRALTPQALADLCGGHARRSLCAPDFAAAWKAALAAAPPARPILITGSLYLVGEARGFLLGARAGAERPEPAEWSRLRAAAEPPAAERRRRATAGSASGN